MKSDIKNRADIVLLVDTFYQKVQENETLGPIFNDIAQINWQDHLPKMYDFWDSILFGSAIYKGNPMRPHFALNHKIKLETGHFEIWQQTFFNTVDELFEGENSILIKQKAQSIAQLMHFKLNSIHVIPVKNKE